VAPVAWMSWTPRSDALDVRGTGDVITVARLLEPAVLAGSFAGLATLGGGAVALPSGAARVGHKESLTMLTLTLGDWTCH